MDERRARLVWSLGREAVHCHRTPRGGDGAVAERQVGPGVGVRPSQPRKITIVPGDGTGDGAPAGPGVAGTGTGPGHPIPRGSCPTSTTRARATRRLLDLVTGAFATLPGNADALSSARVR